MKIITIAPEVLENISLQVNYTIFMFLFLYRNSSYVLEISLRSTGVASESRSINARTRILFVLLETFIFSIQMTHYHFIDICKYKDKNAYLIWN